MSYGLLILTLLFYQLSNGEDHTEFGIISAPLGDLVCYSCKFARTTGNVGSKFNSFRREQEQAEGNEACLQGKRDKMVATRCRNNTQWCMTRRTSLWGQTIELERGCSSYCPYGCRYEGFDLTYEICYSCCKDNGCNWNLTKHKK